MLPGVNGNAVLVFTVVDKEENKDQFLGQIALPLKDLWKDGGRFDIDLEDLSYVIKESNGQNSEILYEKIDPQGYLTIELTPLSFLHSACGYLDGPHFDILAPVSKTKKAKATMSSVFKSGKDSIMTYWCCIANGELNIYKNFHDSEPRIVIDLEPFSLMKEKKERQSNNNTKNGQLGTPTKGGGTPSRGGGGGVNSNTNNGTSNTQMSNTISSSSPGRHGSPSKRRGAQGQHEATQRAPKKEQVLEFSFRSSDASLANRPKYTFTAPTARECRHWSEVIEHWSNSGKKQANNRKLRNSSKSRKSISEIV